MLHATRTVEVEQMHSTFYIDVNKQEGCESSARSTCPRDEDDKDMEGGRGGHNGTGKGC